jgi:anthranilate/para-aminobenzoate synthase component I
MRAVERLDAPPDPFLLARALSGCPSVALVLGAPARPSYLACHPVARATGLDPEPSLPLTPCAHGEIPRWIGLLPYEALRSLERTRSHEARPPPDLVEPVWYRYAALIEITNEVRLLSDNPHAAREVRRSLLEGLRPAQGPAQLELGLRHVELGARHAERVRAALELIARGELYQVNLARRFGLSVRGSASEVLAALLGGVPAEHGLSADFPELSVACASPELCLSLDAARRLQTSPIKGTRPRHGEPARDRALALELDQDEKERAELAMVIDVERNDLGRVAEVGSVTLAEPPHVVSLPSVHHRLATVAAVLRPGLGRAELLAAVLPSGSVTGAPKLRAMQAIAELEPARRGLYTGALGVVQADGGLRLAMAIRTLTFRDGEGSYFAGGGIVADSEPAREVEETLWKARRLIDLVGRPIENWA